MSTFTYVCLYLSLHVFMDFFLSFFRQGYGAGFLSLSLCFALLGACGRGSLSLCARALIRQPARGRGPAARDRAGQAKAGPQHGTEERFRVLGFTLTLKNLPF